MCIGYVAEQDVPTVGFFGGKRKTGVDPDALVPLQHATDASTRPGESIWRYALARHRAAEDAGFAGPVRACP
eukprot:11193451-Lingulodinium_polyedra.AAC.1